MIFSVCSHVIITSDNVISIWGHIYVLLRASSIPLLYICFLASTHFHTLPSLQHCIIATIEIKETASSIIMVNTSTGTQ